MKIPKFQHIKVINRKNPITLREEMIVEVDKKELMFDVVLVDVNLEKIG